MAFTSDGSIVATTTAQLGFIILLRTLDGGIIDSRKYSGGLAISNFSNFFKGILVKKN